MQRAGIYICQIKNNYEEVNDLIPVPARLSIYLQTKSRW
jgi:hypothetical protein